MDFTIITTCMNRNNILEQSLPTWLTQPVDEIIILDWSSTESLKSIVDKNQNGKIILATIEGKRFFNKPRALNTAIRLSTRKNIFLIDSDIKLHERILYDHPIDSSLFYTGDGLGTNGTGIVSKENILKINGFSELFEGWGCEDENFWVRLEKLSLSRIKFSKNYLDHIPHDNILRGENYEVTDIGKSFISNLEIEKEDSWRINNHIQEKQDVILYYPNGDIKKINI